MSAVLVEDLGKRFRQYLDRGTLVDRLPGRKGRRVQEIWALRHVDLAVERGGTLGIIGPNGSGKTTLLRLLSGVSGPSEGRLRIEGRIASLIGIGVGFNRELTGRENVTVNGRLLGMSAREVADAYDEIVAFSELADFIDLPVKFYSSGMFLRLAFSIAIHTDPDVLLIDEILAVGDIGFQAKCFERMRQLQDGGTTIIVVTHNLQVLQQLTTRTAVLNEGRLRFDGSTDQAIASYHEALQSRVDTHTPSTPGPIPGRRYANIADVQVAIEDADGVVGAQVHSRRPMAIRVEATFREPATDPVVALLVERPGIGRLFATASSPRGPDHTYGPGRPMTTRLVLDDVPLLPATYSVHVELRAPASDVIYGLRPATLFHVTGDGAGSGSVDFRPHMEVDGNPTPIIQPRLGTSS